MSKILIINGDLNNAKRVLKEAGIQAEIGNALDYGLKCEAEYRLNCYLEDNDEKKETYDNMSEKSKLSIINSIAYKYSECGSTIFDYDYMDDIVDEEFNMEAWRCS